MRGSVVSILLLFLALSSIGQEPYLRNYKVKDGLPSNNIYQVIQDKNGIICVSTDEGIAKFDGNTFKIITAQQGLPDDEVFSILESPSGKKWFVTQNGKLGFQDIFENFHIIKTTNHNQNNQSIIRSIAITNDERVFFTKNHYLFSCVNQHIQALWNNINLDLVWSFNNEIFLALGNAIISYPSLDTVAMLPFNGHGTTRISYFENKRVALCEGLFCAIVSSTGKVVETLSAPKESGEIISCFSPNNHEYWLGTRNGILIVEKGTNEIKSTFLRGLSISSITKDHEGNYWISSLEKGLFFWPNSQLKRIDCFSQTSPAIHALCLHNHQLWIGLDNGKYASINSDLKNLNCTEYSLAKTSNEPVMKFRPLEQELFTISKAVSQSHEDTSRELNLYLNDIIKIGNKWAIISNPVSILNNDAFETVLSQDSTPKVKNDLLQSKALSINNGICTAANTDFSLWIGSQNGLYHYNILTKISKQLFTHSITSAVHNMDFLPNQDLVVATNQNGIIIIRNNTVIDQFSQKDGLAAGKAKAFCIDRQGNIWLSISNQLFQIASASRIITNYSLKLGIDLETIICINVIDHNLLIGTDHGLFQYDLHADSTQNNLLKLSNFAMWVKGKRWNWKTNNILPSNANQIAFEYHALSYLYPTASTHLIIVMFNLLNSNLQICLQTGQGPV